MGAKSVVEATRFFGARRLSDEPLASLDCIVLLLAPKDGCVAVAAAPFFVAFVVASAVEWCFAVCELFCVACLLVAREATPMLSTAGFSSKEGIGGRDIALDLAPEPAFAIEATVALCSVEPEGNPAWPFVLLGASAAGFGTK